jgi:hypothetical protein
MPAGKPFFLQAIMLILAIKYSLAISHVNVDKNSSIS